jgi:hypothetical protein
MKAWKNLQVSRRGIVLDPTTGESFRLNESAGVILNGLQRDQSPEDIAATLSRDFDTTYEAALSDVYEFAANLNIQGIGE